MYHAYKVYKIYQMYNKVYTMHKKTYQVHKVYAVLPPTPQTSYPCLVGSSVRKILTFAKVFTENHRHVSDDRSGASCVIASWCSSKVLFSKESAGEVSLGRDSTRRHKG